MKRFIRKISVLLISLFICLNIIVPCNDIYASAIRGALYFYNDDNPEEPFLTYRATYNESIQLEWEGDLIDGLVVGYSNEIEGLVLNVEKDVELDGVSFLCEKNLAINLKNDLTINTNVSSPSLNTVNSISSTSFNRRAHRIAMSKFDIQGTLYIYGDHELEINYGLDDSFVVNENHESLPLPYRGILLSANGIIIGEGQVESDNKTTVSLNEYRTEQQKNSYSIFIVTAMDIDTLGIELSNANFEINTYSSGITSCGSFDSNYSDFTINRLYANSSPSFFGINMQNVYDIEDMNCNFKNSNINITEDGYYPVSNAVDRIQNSYAFGAACNTKFEDCFVNFDVSKSGGYAINYIDLVSDDDEQTPVNIEFVNGYVNLIGGVRLSYGNLKFYKDVNFYVTAENHEPLYIINENDSYNDSYLDVSLTEIGTGLFEYTGSDNFSWNNGFNPVDGFAKAYASAVQNYPWIDAENYMNDYSSNYRWVCFRNKCNVTVQNYPDFSGEKDTFSKYSSFPSVKSSSDKTFIGWFYTNSKGKEIKFIPLTSYIREDMILSPKIEQDEPVVPTLYPVELQVPTLTQDGVMPYYHDGQQNYFKDPEGLEPIDDLDAWRIGEGRIKALSDENEIYSLTIQQANGNEIETPKSNNMYYFVSDAAFDKFAGLVYLDDVRVLEDKYDSFILDDKTSINFSDDIINDLQDGEHTIRIVSKDGFAFDCFFVNCKASDVPLTYFEGDTVTMTQDGSMPYYRDQYTGKYFKDPNRENEIEDLDAWKLDEGRVAKISKENEKYKMTITPGTTIKTPIADNKYEFKSDANLDLFASIVYVDNKNVNPSNYTFKKGSTIIKFNDKFINNLSEGSHTILILSKDGHASGTFKVEKTHSSDDHHSDSSYKVPKTGIK